MVIGIGTLHNTSYMQEMSLIDQKDKEKNTLLGSEEVSSDYPGMDKVSFSPEALAKLQELFSGKEDKEDNSAEAGSSSADGSQAISFGDVGGQVEQIKKQIEELQKKLLEVQQSQMPEESKEASISALEAQLSALQQTLNELEAQSA